MAYYKCGKIFATQNSNTSIETASGAIANFRTSLAIPVLDCIADFSATQASGTPTPSAPIPIVGVDKVNIMRTGKNLFSSSFVIGSRANLTTGVFEPYTDGARTDYILIKSNMALTFSGFYNGFSSYFSYYDRNKNYISRSSSTPRTTATETPPTNACYVVVSYVKISGQTGDISTILNYNHQLELGSTATDYEPYNGITVLINLGGTYYGGSVDVVTGRITLTHKKVVFDENLPLSDFGLEMITGYARLSYIPIQSDGKGNTEFISNTLHFVQPNATKNIYDIWNTTSVPRMFIALPDTITTKQEAVAWFEDNPTEIVYVLATPLVVYASNTAEIPTIVGDNQVYADTGNVEVKYRRINNDL